MTAGREFHVQHRRPGLEAPHHLERQVVNDIDRVVQGMGEIDPAVAAVRPRHRENRLTVRCSAADFLEAAQIDRDKLVTSDRRDQQAVAGDGPSFQMRHLVDRELLLTSPIVVENAFGLERLAPKIDVDDAVLTEQSRQVMPAVGSHIAVVGQLADTG